MCLHMHLFINAMQNVVLLVCVMTCLVELEQLHHKRKTLLKQGVPGI